LAKRQLLKAPASEQLKECRPRPSRSAGGFYEAKSNSEREFHRSHHQPLHCHARRQDSSRYTMPARLLQPRMLAGESGTALCASNFPRTIERLPDETPAAANVARLKHEPDYLGTGESLEVFPRRHDLSFKVPRGFGESIEMFIAAVHGSSFELQVREYQTRPVLESYE